MRFLIGSCKKSTFLITKKEEKKLSVWEDVQLSIHLFFCKWCKRFQKQNHLLSVSAKHIHVDVRLSAEARQKIADHLKNE